MRLAAMVNVMLEQVQQQSVRALALHAAAAVHFDDPIGPGFVQPIAPVRRTEPFDDPAWIFDLKYDGFRGLCYLAQGRCRMISRNGNLMSRFTSLGDQIAAALDVGDAILDGEIIAADAPM